METIFFLFHKNAHLFDKIAKLKGLDQYNWYDKN